MREILPDGLAQAAHTALPVAASDAPDLVALLDVALAALAGVAVWQIVVRRRPVAGLVAVGVGLAYCWTVRPPDSPAVAGVLALAGFVAVLALAGWRGSLDPRGAGRLGGAVALGGVALLVAVGLGSGPAQTGDGWWSWKDWDFGARSAAGSGAALDLTQSYGKLDWPSTPRIALTVELRYGPAPARGEPRGLRRRGVHAVRLPVVRRHGGARRHHRLRPGRPHPR